MLWLIYSSEFLLLESGTCERDLLVFAPLQTTDNMQHLVEDILEHAGLLASTRWTLTKSNQT